MFIENMGQFPEEVRFQVRGTDRLLWLTDDALWITLLEPGTRPDAEMERRLPHAFPVEDAAPESRQGVHLKLSFVGANSRPRLEPFGRLETKVSYFIGNDPEQWRPDVPVWGGVRYVDLYPGLDLEVSSDGGRWSWRLAADATRSASLSAVTLQVEGADSLTLAGDALHLATGLGGYTLPMVQGMEATGSLAAPALIDNQIRQPFAHAARAPLSALRSTSALAYATFLGGSGRDTSGLGIGLDRSGAAYVTGTTSSSDFPITVGGFATIYNGGYSDAFVVKINPTGTNLIYASFLGGSSEDTGYGIAVDETEAAYVTGWTASSDFPTCFCQSESASNDHGKARQLDGMKEKEIMRKRVK